MKKLYLILFILFGIIFPHDAKAGDVTVLLTIKGRMDQNEIQNELWFGNWENGKDGFDSLDVQAMSNGLFDSYFEIPSENGNSAYRLWRDIRSAMPFQEWKLILKSPSPRSVAIEWKQFPYGNGEGSVQYRFLDPDTGLETDLNNESGSLALSIWGSKTLILISRPK